MEIILLDKVAHLGNLGEIVRVKDGFARNFLIPKRKAKRATPLVIKEFELKRTELEKEALVKIKAALELSEKLTTLLLKVEQKAGVDGKLFGSVTSLDIVRALAREGFDKIGKHQIRLPSGLIKTLGEHTVTAHLHTDVNVHLRLLITKQID